MRKPKIVWILHIFWQKKFQVVRSEFIKYFKRKIFWNLNIWFKKIHNFLILIQMSEVNWNLMYFRMEYKFEPLWWVQRVVSSGWPRPTQPSPDSLYLWPASTMLASTHARHPTVSMIQFGYLFLQVMTNDWFRVTLFLKNVSLQKGWDTGDIMLYCITMRICI